MAYDELFMKKRGDNSPAALAAYLNQSVNRTPAPSASLQGQAPVTSALLGRSTKKGVEK